MKPRFVLCAALCFLAACSVLPEPDPGVPEPLPRPSLDRRIAVFDGRDGRALSFADLLRACEGADVVFVGETHLDETTHEVEHALLAALSQRRRVVLSLEMFERDVQPILDEYLSGTIDEREFLARARPWGNYRTAYRPLVETARRLGLPVVAANVPAALRRRIALGGMEVFENLGENDRALVARRLYDESEAYWRRVDNAVRGHRFGRGGDRRTSGQSLWDNTMAESIVRALEEHPGALVLHVNGGFHSAYHDGVVRLTRLRRPDLAIRTIDVTPVLCPAETTLETEEEPIADFVVAAAARNRDEREGRYGTLLVRELTWRLHVPHGAALHPLVLVLGDDHATAREMLALWGERLGGDCMVAAFEPALPGEAPDLVWAGRWYRPGELAEEAGGLAAALERTVGYLARRLGADPARVVLLGEGAGATAALAAALRTSDVAWHVVAVAPRRGEELRDLPLPLARDGRAAVPTRDVTVLARAEALPEGELDQWRAEKIDARRLDPPEDDVALDDEAERVVRELLGLAPRGAAAPRPDTGGPTSRRARLWRRILAARGLGEAILDAAALARPGTIPPAEGPFGGTTVLVVEPDALAELEDLVEHDPLAAHSRFHRLRLATLGPPRPLGDVLDTLAEEGRRNVLVVPARFCADPETMRRIERAVGDRADRMTISYRPGLGDRLGRTDAP